MIPHHLLNCPLRDVRLGGRQESKNTWAALPDWPFTVVARRRCAGGIGQWPADRMLSNQRPRLWRRQCERVRTRRYERTLTRLILVFVHSLALLPSPSSQQHGTHYLISGRKISCWFQAHQLSSVAFYLPRIAYRAAFAKTG
ncbi:hypothetical protein LZ32DRAFT_340340 [Colletotrichum eremochloae]|nr:hypothetical protein LZ32DRAFT_340340 [Colletotrichum eremochloae]